MHTGLARFEYRHFIIFGPQSEFAALATECAGDQGHWWDFHDEYMTGNAVRYTRKGALEYAGELGLNEDEFTQCLDDKRHLDRLQRMQADALERGIPGTPTITINGNRVGNNPATIIRRVRELAGLE